MVTDTMSIIVLIILRPNTMLLESAKKFAEQYIRPHIMEWDEAQFFPVDLLKKAGEMALWVYWCLKNMAELV